jgi:hypothetical protein
MMHLMGTSVASVNVVYLAEVEEESFPDEWN